jgi:hypothetical protein
MRCFRCRGTATETDDTCFVEYGVWKEETFEVEFNAPVYRCDKCNIIFVCEVIAQKIVAVVEFQPDPNQRSVKNG